jgi:hypothetical protein
VDFSTPFLILKPVDPQRGNQKIFHAGFRESTQPTWRARRDCPSLQELYGSHARFVDAVTRAANQLVNERFLLDVVAAADISVAQESCVLQ